MWCHVSPWRRPSFHPPISLQLSWKDAIHYEAQSVAEWVLINIVPGQVDEGYLALENSNQEAHAVLHLPVALSQALQFFCSVALFGASTSQHRYRSSHLALRYYHHFHATRASLDLIAELCVAFAFPPFRAEPAPIALWLHSDHKLALNIISTYLACLLVGGILYHMWLGGRWCYTQSDCDDETEKEWKKWCCSVPSLMFFWVWQFTNKKLRTYHHCHEQGCAQENSYRWGCHDPFCAGNIRRGQCKAIWARPNRRVFLLW